MKKTVSFYTLGCRLNQAETAILEQAFTREGFTPVRFDQPADLVVINTCTVTENGDTGTRKIVNRIHRNNPNAQIALVGCQAQTQKERLLDMPGVNWVIGNQVKLDLPQIMRQNQNEPHVIVPDIEDNSFTLPVPGIDSRHTRANLKIQDGCNAFCSYCEIPYARGRARSRVFADLVQEANVLVKAGHKELVLTGINVGTYSYQGKGIADVVRALETIDGLERVRISSMEATTFPHELLTFMTPNHKLCRFMHISLQSGSDKILGLMGRKYTRDQFAAFLRQAYDAVPGICLGTDVIVGFPGETDADFDDTYQYLRDLPFTYFHVFSYSDRENARSKDFPGKAPKETIKQRNQVLRELSMRKRRTYLESMLGKTGHVLFEHNKKGDWQGHTDTYINVRVSSEQDLYNRLLPVRLTGIDGQNMTGELQ